MGFKELIFVVLTKVFHTAVIQVQNVTQIIEIKIKRKHLLSIDLSLSNFLSI